MDINIFPKEQLQKLQDIEAGLLTRKKNGRIAGNLALLSFVVQAILIAWPVFTELIPFIEDGAFEQYSEYLRDPRIYIPLFLSILFFAVYFLLRRTSLLVRETSEPFRYTFFVEPFVQAENAASEGYELKNAQRLNLLHLDLTELINNRIKRFSINQYQESEKTNLSDIRKSNHIEIYGHFSIREDKDNEDWIIHLMPFVRIGSPDSPSTLAQSVRFPLTGDTPDVLDTREYNQFLERVYSQITTEIYAQIEKDIRDKIELFPTPYLQAKAYFYEAEDMAKSNTINSFDSAINLYKEAIKKMDLTFKRQLLEFWVRLPLLRIFIYRYLHQYARILTGHAKCLIYKKRISVLSGRKSNSIFEVRNNLGKIIGLLEYFQAVIADNRENLSFKHDRKTFFNLAYFSFPRDSWLRKILLKPSSQLFDDTRKILFEAYVIHALADTVLHAFISARNYLNKARAIAPDLSQADVLYTLAEGYLEPNIEKALLIFQKATEKDPAFQIAQYDLAYWTEMKFRKDGVYDKNRALTVLEEYDKVLKINPGNIAALAAQGYILWLLKDFDQAKRKFQEGIEIKALVSETYIGLLIYGLARALAEQGHINKSYDLFNQAIATNPNVGAFAMNDSWIFSSFYEFVTPGLLKRYEDYLANYSYFWQEKLNIIGMTNDEEDDFELKLAKQDSPGLAPLMRALRLPSTITKISPGNAPKVWEVEVALESSSPVNYRTETYRMRKSGRKIIVSNEPAKLALNGAMSFVQNDLGNAYLNYYKRFGDINDLDRAIELFTKAIENYPMNIVAKYNKSLALALDTSTDPKSDSIKLLDEVFKDCPKWIDAWASYFEFVVRTSGSFKIYKAKVREIEEKIKAEEQKLAKTWATGAGLSKSQPESINTEQQSYIEKLRIEKAELFRKENEKVLEIIRRIIESTNLITLYNGFQLENLDNLRIEELIAKKIDWMRLDDEDVRALKIYASWFYYDKCQLEDKIDREALLSLKRIFDHILGQYYPEDFDILFKKKALLKQLDHENVPEITFNSKLASSRLSSSIAHELNEGRLPSEIRQLFFDSGIVLPPDRNLIIEATRNGYLLSAKTPLGNHNKYLVKRDGREIALYQSDIEYCEKAMESLTCFGIEMDPINYDQLAYSAEILNPEKHLAILDKALQLTQSNAVLYFLHFKACHRLGKMNEFIENFEQPESLSGLPLKKAAVYYDIGNYFGLDGKAYFENAAKYYQLALEERRTNPNDNLGLDYYYDLLAEASYKAGRLNEFTEYFEKSADLSDQPEKKAKIFNDLGNYLFRDNRPKEAMPYYLKAIKLNRAKPIYYANLALMYSRTEPPNWGKAMDYYQKAVNLRKKNSKDTYDLDYYYDYLAEASYKAGKLEEFIQQFNLSGDLDDQPIKKAVVYNSIGNSLYYDKRPKEAMSYYYKAISLNEKMPIYYANLALMHAKDSPPDWRNAAKYYERALELRKTKKDDSYGLDYYYDYYAEACYKADRLNEFVRDFEASGDLDDQPAKKSIIYNTIGNLLYRNQKIAEAVPYYQKAIENDKNRPIYHANLGLMYANFYPPDWAMAHYHYQQALHLRKKTPNDTYGLEYYYDYLSEASYKAGKLDEFLMQLELSGDLKDRPAQMAILYNTIGNALYQDYKTEEAIPYYKKAIDRDKGRPIYYANLGLMYSSLDNPNWEQALDCYREALRIRRNTPNDPYGLDYYYNYLAEASYKVGKLKEFMDVLNASGDDETVKDAVNKRIQELEQMESGG